MRRQHLATADLAARRQGQPRCEVLGRWPLAEVGAAFSHQSQLLAITVKRDLAAARRFFEQAIDLHDVPEKITIDKSGANTAAVHSMVADIGVAIVLRQSKYLNNLIESPRDSWRPFGLSQAATATA